MYHFDKGLLTLCFLNLAAYAIENETVKPSAWYTLIPPIKQQIEEYQSLYKDSIENKVDIGNVHNPLLLSKLKQGFSLCEMKVAEEKVKMNLLRNFWDQALQLLKAQEFTLNNYKKQIFRLICLTGPEALSQNRAERNIALKELALEDKWMDLKNYPSIFETGPYCSMKCNSFYDAILFIPKGVDVSPSKINKMVFGSPVPMMVLAFCVEPPLAHGGAFPDSLSFYLHDEYHARSMSLFFKETREYGYYEVLRSIYHHAKEKLKPQNKASYKKVEAALFLLGHEFNWMEFIPPLESYPFKGTDLDKWKSIVSSFDQNFSIWLERMKIVNLDAKTQEQSTIPHHLISFLKKNISSKHALSIDRDKVPLLAHPTKLYTYLTTLWIHDNSPMNNSSESFKVMVELFYTPSITHKYKIQWSVKNVEVIDSNPFSFKALLVQHSLRNFDCITPDHFFFLMKDWADLLCPLIGNQAAYLEPLIVKKIISNYLKDITPYIEALYQPFSLVRKKDIDFEGVFK